MSLCTCVFPADLSLEGLYRVSGQSSEILDLKEKYDEGVLT